jgi:PAS domain S-box-containing protein
MMPVGSGRGEPQTTSASPVLVQVYVLLALLAASLFLIDLYLPLHTAAGIGYVAVVMLSLWVPGRIVTVHVAWACVAMAVAAAWFAPAETLWNRALCVLVVAATAFLGQMRRRAQEELSRSEQRYRALFTQSNDAIVVADAAADRIVDANDRARELVGSGGDLRGRQFSSLFVDPARAVEPLLAEVAAKGGAAAEGVVLRTPDNTALPCGMRASLVELDEQRCVQVVLRDIRAHQRAEQAIRTRAQQQAAVAQLGARTLERRELGELFDDAVAVVSSTLGVEFCKILELLDQGRNLRLCAGVGWENGLVGNTVLRNDGGHAGLGPVLDEPVIVDNAGAEPHLDSSDFLSRHGIVSGITVVIHIDGGAFGVLGAHTTRAREFSEDDAHFLQAVANLLGLAIQRLRADSLLQQSERRFRSLVEATSDCMWEVDRAGVITYASATIEKLLGCPPADILGLALVEMGAQAEANGVAGALRRAIDCGERIVRLERTVQHHDGRTVVLETSGVPIIDGAGAIVGVRGIDRDITERRQAARQLEEAMEAAQAANLTKSLFLANMSHELRTPMTAVLGFTESLLQGELAGEERQQATEIIRRNCRHLLDLVNDILDVSKIEAGMMRVERMPCSLIEILADVASVTQISARAKLVRFAVEFATPVPERISTDPTRLRQILMNLAGNAVKFTDVGSVRLTVALASEPAPLLSFDIVDTGVGVSEAQAKRLFQPFTQADISMTRRYGGTGLGLAISRELAVMLGGDIVLVRSAPNEGAHFRITIDPGALQGVALLERPDLRSGADGSGASPDADQPALDCRVLVAEDGRDNQILVRHILRRAGAAVDFADNGQVAVETALQAQAHGEAYDVILMDMQMPVMDGYQATAELRARGYQGKIIALTANAMEGVEDLCLDAGCDDYATKPIDRSALLGKLRAHLAR